MNAPFIGPLTQDESKAMRFYYVIYSIDITREAEYLVDHMDPNAIGRTDGRVGAVSLDGLWRQTEGDEQYEFDYLADEMAGSDHPCPRCNGERTTDEHFTAPDGFVGVGIVDVASYRSMDGERYITEERPCPGCGGTGGSAWSYRNGYHRKWVGELNHDQYLALANDRGWDLDDDDRPERFNDTMGSITEYGHLPAIAVEDDEGWSYGGEVIMAQFYVTMGELPLGYSEPLHESKA